MMSDQLTKSQRQADYQRRTGYKDQRKYEKENTVRISLVLGKNTDADLIAKLESVKSKNGYIRELIRADIAGAQI